MKPFNTLSNDELCEITLAQLNQYVEYALAEAGYPLELEPLEQPTPKTHDPDLEYISLDFRGVLVDVEIGRQIQDILSNNIVRTKNYNGVISVVKPDAYDYPKFELQRLESEELKAKKAASNKLLDLEWEEYNNREDERAKSLSYREQILDELYKQISSARSERYERNTKLEAWNKYLTLANNDRNIAKNFFIERYSSAEYDSLFDSEE